MAGRTVAAPLGLRTVGVTADAGQVAVDLQVRRASEEELATGGMEMVTSTPPADDLAWAAGPLLARWSFGALR